MSAISAQDKKETFDGIGDVGFVILSLEILGESQEANAGILTWCSIQLRLRL